MKNTMGTNLFLSNPLLKEHQHTMMEELGNNDLAKKIFKILFYTCKSLALLEISHVIILLSLKEIKRIYVAFNF